MAATSLASFAVQGRTCLRHVLRSTYHFLHGGHDLTNISTQGMVAASKSTASHCCGDALTGSSHFHCIPGGGCPLRSVLPCMTCPSSSRFEPFDTRLDLLSGVRDKWRKISIDHRMSETNWPWDNLTQLFPDSLLLTLPFPSPSSLKLLGPLRPPGRLLWYFILRKVGPLPGGDLAIELCLPDETCGSCTWELKTF